MRDFEGFYQRLPDLLKGDLKSTFVPALQGLKPRPEDEWVVLLDEEMLALIEHPDIQWNRVDIRRYDCPRCVKTDRFPELCRSDGNTFFDAD